VGGGPRGIIPKQAVLTSVLSNPAPASTFVFFFPAQFTVQFVNVPFNKIKKIYNAKIQIQI
jgi:hypothetical protein